MLRGVVFALALSGAAHALAASTFETCASSATARPAEYESYRCYYEVASRTGEWHHAAMQLERLARRSPQIDWIVFARALVATPVDKNAAEILYEEAARRFQAAANVRGEMLARANLQVMLYESGRAGSAAREVERVAELGRNARDSELRIRARLVEAQFFISTGTNLGRAHRALKQAETELEGDPKYFLRQHVLHDLGRVLMLTGQYDQALTYFRRLQDEAASQQDLSTEARARLDAINTLLEKRGEEAAAVNIERLFADAEDALAAARRAQNLDLELDALRILAEAMLTDRPHAARGYADTCVARAQASGRPQSLSQCLWIKARLLAGSDPAAARQAMDAAIGQLQGDGGNDHRLLAYAWRHAMRIAWQTQPAEAALETGKEALAAIERLRDLQPGLHGRAAAFASWTQDYYWLSGQILRLATTTRDSTVDTNGTATRSHVDEAFRIGERMRARSLLDRLRAPSVELVDRDAVAVQQRDAALTAIADLNRQRLQANGARREDLLVQLEALERQELDAREARDPRHVTASSVSLQDLQQSLNEREALLSFQIGPNEGTADRPSGGSWLFAITRDDARVVPLPDRHALTQSLSLFTGLMRQSPAHRQRAAIALYDQLLATALSQLPSNIERLIIVPDSPVDTFPLSALGASPTGAADGFEPLAERFEIALVPSATIWHDWRTRPGQTRAASLLVIADPQLEFASDAISPERSWLQDSKLSLGALPHARAEGEQIIEHVGGRGTLWTSDQASESALKAADLANHSVLHFAAHTVIDGGNADRSAILLASGTDREDGLLQSREIADLRLDGQLVVLSSCQSAMGTHVRGEGVLGLSRAFFASGARAVVGSLWPIRDDQARAFFERFYAALARGQSVGAAFRHTQRDLIENDFPMETWAGFVLMGDANVKPVTRMDRAWQEWTAWLLVAVLAGGAIVAGARVRSRRMLAARPQ